MKENNNNNNTDATDELIKLGNEMIKVGKKITKDMETGAIDLSNLSEEEEKTLKKLLDRYIPLFNAKNRELDKLWMKIAEIEKEEEEEKEEGGAKEKK